MKGAFYPVAVGQQTIHPYFDDFEGQPWLTAELIRVPVLGFTFTVSNPGGWDGLRISRAKQHLAAYGLSKLYATNAADEVASRKARLVDLLAMGGPEAVRAMLNEHADELQKTRVNSWRLATYRAAAGSDWFCDGGFNEFSA